MDMAALVRETLRLPFGLPCDWKALAARFGGVVRAFHTDLLFGSLAVPGVEQCTWTESPSGELTGVWWTTAGDRSRVVSALTPEFGVPTWHGARAEWLIDGRVVSVTISGAGVSAFVMLPAAYSELRGEDGPDPALDEELDSLAVDLAALAIRSLRVGL